MPITLSTCHEDCRFWRFISIDHIKWLFKDKVVIAHSVLLVFFYPHETKHHLHLPLWYTSVNPRVSWSHKQITPSRGLVTLVRLSFSPPHSCCVFGGGQTGIWLTQSVFYLLKWLGLGVGIESGNPDLSLFLCMQLLIVSGMLSGSGRHSVLRIRGSSGVSGNIRRSPQLRRSQLGVTGRKRHQVRINHRRVKRVQKEGLENDVLLRSIIMTSRWELIKHQDIQRQINEKSFVIVSYK